MEESKVKDSISVDALLAVIRTLPEDEPLDRPGIWYRTQKQHWIGWLSEYHGPGAYGRQTNVKRDARYAYNHIVCYPMLLWLINAAGVDRDLVAAAHDASESGTTSMGKSAAIRRVVPWETVAAVLWPAGQDADSVRTRGVRESFRSVLAWARGGR